MYTIKSYRKNSIISSFLWRHLHFKHFKHKCPVGICPTIEEIIVYHRTITPPPLPVSVLVNGQVNFGNSCIPINFFLESLSKHMGQYISKKKNLIQKRIYRLVKKQDTSWAGAKIKKKICSWFYIFHYLCGNPDRAGVEVALPHHGAAHDDEGGRREPELVRPKQPSHQNVETGSHLPIRLNNSVSDPFHCNLDPT